jgi:hypothetical protein
LQKVEVPACLDKVEGMLRSGDVGVAGRLLAAIPAEPSQKENWVRSRVYQTVITPKLTSQPEVLAVLEDIATKGFPGRSHLRLTAAHFAFGATRSSEMAEALVAAWEARHVTDPQPLYNTDDDLQVIALGSGLDVAPHFLDRLEVAFDALGSPGSIQFASARSKLAIRILAQAPALRLEADAQLTAAEKEFHSWAASDKNSTDDSLDARIRNSQMIYAYILARRADIAQFDQNWPLVETYARRGLTYIGDKSGKTYDEAKYDLMVRLSTALYFHNDLDGSEALIRRMQSLPVFPGQEKFGNVPLLKIEQMRGEEEERKAHLDELLQSFAVNPDWAVQRASTLIANKELDAAENILTTASNFLEADYRKALGLPQLDQDKEDQIKAQIAMLSSVLHARKESDTPSVSIDASIASLNQTNKMIILSWAPAAFLEAGEPNLAEKYLALLKGDPTFATQPPGFKLDIEITAARLAYATKDYENAKRRCDAAEAIALAANVDPFGPVWDTIDEVRADIAAAEGRQKDLNRLAQTVLERDIKTLYPLPSRFAMMAAIVADPSVAQGIAVDEVEAALWYYLFTGYDSPKMEDFLSDRLSKYINVFRKQPSQEQIDRNASRVAVAAYREPGNTATAISGELDALQIFLDSIDKDEFVDFRSRYNTKQEEDRKLVSEALGQITDVLEFERNDTINWSNFDSSELNAAGFSIEKAKEIALRIVELYERAGDHISASDLAEAVSKSEPSNSPLFNLGTLLVH